MNLTRRRFLTATPLAAAVAYIDPGSLSAQSAPAEPALVVQARATAASATIKTQPLRGSVSVLYGSGGNIAVLMAKAGKLVVDSGISTSRPQIAEALAALGADPVRILINTHWHYDHTDGNEWMHGSGATIWAHENTRARMGTVQHIAAFHADFPASPAGALPTVLFNDSRKIADATSSVTLTHYEPAHTDTDIAVYFTEADVLHTGDTWFNGFYPFIDYATGGSIDGMIRATKRNLATATEKTIIVPGHGRVGDKAQLTASLEMLVAARGAIAELKKQGKSLEETIAAGPTKAYDDPWGKGFVSPAMFTGLVYQGV